MPGKRGEWRRATGRSWGWWTQGSKESGGTKLRGRARELALDQGR